MDDFVFFYLIATTRPTRNYFQNFHLRRKAFECVNFVGSPGSVSAGGTEAPLRAGDLTSLGLTGAQDRAKEQGKRHTSEPPRMDYLKKKNSLEAENAN